MAAPRPLDNSKKPLWTLQVVHPQTGKRCTIGLGRQTEKDARLEAAKVEELRTRVRNGKDAGDLQPWLDALEANAPLRFRALVRSGLATPTPKAETTEPAKVLTLDRFITDYIDRRTPELRPRSIDLLKQTQGHLVAHFKADTDIQSITPAGAKDWRAALLKKGWAEATVRQHTRNVKAMFNDAVDSEIITRNPFRNLDSAAIAADREVYISPEDAAKVLAELPGIQHKVLFGLARYAGLRVPSETHNLRWQDIDFDKARMRVYAPKAHRHGKTRAQATRTVPIVGELMTLLQQAYDEAPTGATRVLEISTNNMHRTLEQAIIAAGLPVWDDAFQALRRSRETEWLAQHPAHVCSAWLGHTVAVQQKHYAQVRDEDFAAAANAAQMMQPSLDTTGPPSPNAQPGRHAQPVMAGAGHNTPDSQDYESTALTAELRGRFWLVSPRNIVVLPT